MENLPFELLDNIIGHIPKDDQKSLQSCSFVARSWTYPCQRRLLETVNCPSEVALWSKLENSPPKNVGIFHHVRSLSVGVDLSPYRRSEALARIPHIELPLFPYLRYMVLRYSGGFSALRQLGVALASQDTLESLSLILCRVSTSALVALINHFPNLVHVRLVSLQYEPNGEPIPPLARPLQKLSVNYPGTYDDPGIIDQLLGLQPRCDEVTVEVRFRVAPLLAQRIIDGVRTTVKRLNLGIDKEYLNNPLTLANCPELCELTFYSLRFTEPDIISTIVSPCIQKITIDKVCPDPGSLIASTDPIYWTELDNSLHKVADQSKHKFPLDVEFRFSHTGGWDGWPLFEEHLPKTHEKGRVKVVDEYRDTVVYCSDWASRSQRQLW